MEDLSGEVILNQMTRRIWLCKIQRKKLPVQRLGDKNKFGVLQGWGERASEHEAGAGGGGQSEEMERLSRAGLGGAHGGEGCGQEFKLYSDHNGEH